MMSKKEIQPGSVIVIPLPDDRVAYAAYFKDGILGIYNIISEKKLETDELKNIEIKIYKGCNESIIKKGVWPVIGVIELNDDGDSPDLAYYAEWLPEDSVNRSAINRKGKTVHVDKEYYISLVKKGCILSVFNKPEQLPQWIIHHLNVWPDYEMPD
ncbi:Imm26 family immunity protein [Klebsiella aerogenes]